jgi:hypothetical protein
MKQKKKTKKASTKVDAGLLSMARASVPGSDSEGGPGGTDIILPGPAYTPALRYLTR